MYRRKNLQQSFLKVTLFLDHCLIIASGYNYLPLDLAPGTPKVGPVASGLSLRRRKNKKNKIKLLTNKECSLVTTPLQCHKMRKESTLRAVLNVILVALLSTILQEISREANATNRDLIGKNSF